ncbi:TlpA family protein disulfide reductase [Cognaticolwellia beringensis]|jgi:thiol-disulfide isomerase/thioredoxin|uniref:Thioredoxin domain-containing protein n=1 Tax=Cognaticolwellia beringensis TaxID=1967665 RepID=A0A222GAZ9_9GAMM|nr:TlpA disulfide reductase family protein [Cognaticolwellia beringensis]ASP48980.1 hypothetical protein B5D82_15100 [Cognaticolwellia beringensis]|tara:strand:+ start:1583 stop:2044 length:462 start_codon:yes stop_codon:yes gene_type:complete
MKIITSALIILTLCINVVSANEVPQLHYKDIVEKNVGNVIYLDFWASWCTPCRRSFPWMNELQKKYGNKNFKVISINVDSERELAEEFLANTPAKFSVLYDPDGALASEMKLKGMPSSFIINADGVVVSAHVGFTDKKKSIYEQEIKQLIQGN